LVVLVGVGHGDGEREATYLARKIATLRVFEDDGGRLNRSLAEIGGSVLAVSQFTLYGKVRKGRRPSFTDAAHPQLAQRLFDHFCAALKSEGIAVQMGVFRAKMEVALVNDGPVTLWLDTDDLLRN
jgi:D-tyrosyl-tRNA(Tyr) deacylase